MTFDDYLRVLRKRWRILALFIVLGLAGAAAVTWHQRPVYEANEQLFVSAHDTGASVAGLEAAGQFTQQRVQSYADIVNSPQVANAVAQDVGVASGRQIMDEVSATAPTNTVLVDVKVHDHSAARAVAIANSIGVHFSQFVDELETPLGSDHSPVKVSVVKQAQLPTPIVSPRKSLNLILGGLAGLVLGLALGLLRETLDRTIKSADAVQAQTSVPLLGSIAYDRDAKKRPLIVHVDRHSTRAEAFRQLRTNLQFIDIDEPPRSIVVTSAIPNEGKTTTAANLAIALAQSGMSVLLVESDLRRPKIAEYLGIEGAIGLTNVLVGQCEFQDAVQPWGEDGRLTVLPSGATPPNPSELLGSRGMAALISAAEKRYDLVLIDAPPLLPVTDAAVISNIASGALVVVRHGHTKREQLDRAVQSLRSVGAAIYGVVLTMTPHKGREAYQYGYGYRYEKSKNRQQAGLVTPIPLTARAHIGSGSINDSAGVSGHAASGQNVAVLRTPYPTDSGDELVREPLEYFRR